MGLVYTDVSVALKESTEWIFGLFGNHTTVCTPANKVFVLIQHTARALPGIHCHHYMYTTGSC